MASKNLENIEIKKENYFISNSHGDLNCSIVFSVLFPKYIPYMSFFGVYINIVRFYPFKNLSGGLIM